MLIFDEMSSNDAVVPARITTGFVRAQVGVISAKRCGVLCLK